MSAASVMKKFTPREKEVAGKVIKVLKEHLNPGRIILFGSRVKGTHYHGSDFDFAVDVKKPDAMRKFELEDAIDAVSSLYSVDVVYLKDVDSSIRKIILTTGKVVYERGNEASLDSARPGRDAS